MTRPSTGALAIVLLLALLPAVATEGRGQTPSPIQPAPVQPPPAVVPEAPAAAMSCGDCHADETKAFRTNAHGHAKAPKDGFVPNEVCASCHGDGKAHSEGGGDKTLIFTPRDRAGADKSCLPCHDLATERISRHAGVHASSAAVNCLTCHSIHKAEPRVPHLLAQRELTLCSSCHITQAASFRNKPYTHRIGRGGMECSSCHEPHGPAGGGSLRTTAAGELPCLGCHFEKRGPFVFPHAAGAASGDCLTCHEAHGSSNPKMLKRATVAQVCIECHSPLTAGPLGSQPPSFHNLNLPRYQNCTSCHAAVHGSNRDPRLLK
ncbi:MAG: cytochrome family protein [Acidobacteria bacterium]|nr:cytochrome family protein [Acidobacteriota bacterium]